VLVDTGVQNDVVVGGLLGENPGAMGGVAENWGTGSETAHKFSEMTVAKASMFEGDCGYPPLFEQVNLLTSLVCLPLR
jgi:hypothetical protein